MWWPGKGWGLGAGGGILGKPSGRKVGNESVSNSRAGSTHLFVEMGQGRIKSYLPPVKTPKKRVALKPQDRSARHGGVMEEPNTSCGGLLSIDQEECSKNRECLTTNSAMQTS